MESLSVMETYGMIDIQELPLSVPSIRRKVVGFLGSNGLRLEDVDLYIAILDQDGAILAGGGLKADIICCVAVSEAARSGGLSVPLLSRLIAVAAERGYHNLKVFTKPANRAIFQSLGFHLLAEAPQAILMENGRELEKYCQYLGGYRADGVIVMNANPFTFGHRYLVEQASMRVAHLYVIAVKEDASLFSYQERLAMIKQGCADLKNVTVCEGSDYAISAATFPTYFLLRKTATTPLQEICFGLPTATTLSTSDFSVQKFSSTTSFNGSKSSEHELTPIPKAATMVANLIDFFIFFIMLKAIN